MSNPVKLIDLMPIAHAVIIDKLAATSCTHRQEKDELVLYVSQGRTYVIQNISQLVHPENFPTLGVTALIPHTGETKLVPLTICMFRDFTEQDLPAVG
jgi:hypothetical protein